jgi:hypothetical protein
MGEIGSIAYWLLIFSALILVGAMLTPLVEKLLAHFNNRITTAGDEKRIHKIIEVEQMFVRPDRRADRFRDPELDELLLAGRLEEAANLAAERLRLACERGLDERMAFYRDYEQRIAAARVQK